MNKRPLDEGGDSIDQFEQSKRIREDHPCEEKCRVTIRERDHWDIRPHRGLNGELSPCPLMFSADSPVKLVDSDFHAPCPETLCNRVTQYIEDNVDAQTVWSMIAPDDETTLGRDIIQEYFRLVAIRMLIDEAKDLIADNQLLEDEQPVEQYLAMMQCIQRPFATITMADADKHTLCDLFNNYLRFRPVYSNNFNIVLERVEKTFDEAYSFHRFPHDVVTRIKAEISAMRNLMTQVMAARKTIHSPCPMIYNRDNPDHERYMAISIIKTVLSARDVIIVDNTSQDGVMLAMPIISGGVTTHTYSVKMPIHRMLQEIGVDQVVAEKYVLNSRFINGVLATFNERADVPLVKEDFIDAMRYVSWTNGVLCARTGIFYYHREKLPDGMPDNWRHFSDNLSRINKGQIRAMKFINQPCRFYETIVDMLRGVYNRRVSADVMRFYAEHESEPIDHTHGGDTAVDDGRHEQDRFVREMLETFDEWYHNADFLAEMDPLDVRLSSSQKIMQDQRLPRSAYRLWLEMCGRSMCGVLRDTTRKISGSHRALEDAVGKAVSDHLEYATVLEGQAGTGKSTLLNQLEGYFEPELVGRVSDSRRPIDPYQMVRNKALIIAADMQKEDQDPVPAGDLKKMISSERMVNHRLHRDSCIVQFLQHVIFAMNDPLPYTDTKGAMARRFVQLKMTYRVSTANQYFSENDHRTVDEVFNEEDIDRYPVVCILAHKRRLLNVGSRMFYRVDKQGFKVPPYVIGTQAEYCRDQNSFRAFVLGLEREGEVSFGEQYAEHSVERGLVLEQYKNYCDYHKCPVKEDKAVDRHMISTFGCQMGGTPLRYHGLKYRDQSLVFGNADAVAGDEDMFAD